jgi:WD40 repeat protein
MAFKLHFKVTVKVRGRPVCILKCTALALGHTARVLGLTMSPDGATVASAAADETLRLWRCFEMDPALRREREKASVAKSSLIHQGIR